MGLATDTLYFTEAGGGRRLQSAEWPSQSALLIPHGTLGSQGALCFLITSAVASSFVPGGCAERKFTTQLHHNSCTKAFCVATFVALFAVCGGGGLTTQIQFWREKEHGLNWSVQIRLRHLTLGNRETRGRGAVENTKTYTLDGFRVSIATCALVRVSRGGRIQEIQFF